MFRFNESTICKPLIPREHNFYLNMPPALLEFTPEYHGVISVQWLDDGFGTISPVTCRSESHIMSSSSGFLESDASSYSRSSVEDFDADDICSTPTSDGCPSGSVVLLFGGIALRRHLLVSCHVPPFSIA
jgi:hypothetical protein